MAAARFSIDTFLSGYSLRALQDVMEVISAAGDRVERSALDRAGLGAAA